MHGRTEGGGQENWELQGTASASELEPEEGQRQRQSRRTEEGGEQENWELQGTEFVYTRRNEVVSETRQRRNDEERAAIRKKWALKWAAEQNADRDVPINPIMSRSSNEPDLDLYLGSSTSLSPPQDINSRTNLFERESRPSYSHRNP